MQPATVAHVQGVKAALRGLARSVLNLSFMKDIVFIVVTLAFFGVSWIYAKSFDHL